MHSHGVASTGAVPKEGTESMGRRLLLIVGTLLASVSMASAARGQDEGRNSPLPDEPAPLVAPPPPSAFPDVVNLPAPPPGTDPDEGGLARPADSRKNKIEKPKTPGSGPDADSPANDDPTTGIRKGLRALAQGAGLNRPPVDEHVVQAQAPAGKPAAPRPASAAGDGSGTPASSKAAVDVLPVGKQSVAVTVDVQSPASMNKNQKATLKLIVRNTGTSDALNVDIQDELPEELHYESSLPEMTLTGDSHLSARIATLPAGSERLFTIQVKPTKTGPFEHAATVRFETGCKSRTTVLEPRLKVDVVANPTGGKVLKGQPVEFRVTVTNNGDGPARNVGIQAKLTAGLKHESAPKSEEQILYELTLPELMPGQSEKLDPLVADAVAGGEQGCTVIAKSPDVDFKESDAQITRTISVVESKLKLTLKGPESRYTDTIGDYVITAENPGTAPARKIRILATLPLNARLVKTPEGAHYDGTTRKLYWTIDQIEPNGKPATFPFSLRMGAIGRYEVLADGTGDAALKASGRLHTEVVGMPDVDLVVSEKKRVLDVGGTTTFYVTLRNYGTEQATNLQVSAVLSDNLEIVSAGGGSKDVTVGMDPNKHAVKFEQINKLGPNKEMVLGILVKVVGENPRTATCRVSVIHDDLAERFEDMASVKVTSTKRTAAADTNPP
jgi:uncharacterized repeat protein (TIGR01451 family)